MTKPLRIAGVAALSTGMVIGAQAAKAARRAIILDPPQGSPGEFGDPDSPPLHFVVVGDSTSVGVGATSLEATYPWLLAQHLARRFRVTLQVFGRSGARMADAASQLAPQAAATKPDVAIIGIGANDVTHVTPLRRLALDLAIAIGELQAGGASVLVALGPRFDAPVLSQPLRALVQARARALNRTIRRAATKHGAEVLDLPIGVGKSFANDRSLYSSDGFHPSDLGYARWADAMRDQVMNAALTLRILRR